ncbi:hypothetical protein COB21_04250 [Candidatus Aerophobetes bacterium]|uniref:Uncharacterized protein n=1 Tax=Aerophobetes bacterium TaxID=2030807 RepID=A0A2A4X1N2_UNCAE|nr:MAG: hypothetical protein COB21_04250 [Candidatus Aerophobetes bacterium]
MTTVHPVTHVAFQTIKPTKNPSKTDRVAKSIFRSNVCLALQITTFVSLAAMLKTMQSFGICQIRIDRFKIKKEQIAVACFIAGSLLTLCLYLQNKRQKPLEKNTQEIYWQLLHMLNALLLKSLHYLNLQMLELIKALLAWADYLISLCEKNLSLFQQQTRHLFPCTRN